MVFMRLIPVDLLLSQVLGEASTWVSQSRDDVLEVQLQASVLGETIVDARDGRDYLAIVVVDVGVYGLVTYDW